MCVCMCVNHTGSLGVTHLLCLFCYGYVSSAFLLLIIFVPLQLEIALL